VTSFLPQVRCNSETIDSTLPSLRGPVRPLPADTKNFRTGQLTNRWDCRLPERTSPMTKPVTGRFIPRQGCASLSHLPAAAVDGLRPGFEVGEHGRKAVL